MFSLVRLLPRVPCPLAGLSVFGTSLTPLERLPAVGCGFKRMLARLLSLGASRGGAIECCNQSITRCKCAPVPVSHLLQRRLCTFRKISNKVIYFQQKSRSCATACIHVSAVRHLLLFANVQQQSRHPLQARACTSVWHHPCRKEGYEPVSCPTHNKSQQGPSQESP